MNPSHPPMAVVGIGASSGGLAALKQLFAAAPKNSRLAYVVVVHLSPEHESHLPELLQSECAMPVRQVNESTPLEVDHVYVISPGTNLEAVDAHLRVRRLEQSRSERAPIDHFFRTLAETYGNRAVGVILTGVGSDGTLGMKRIKEMGGLTVVQDPKEAEFDGMPASALATGLVDLFLPVSQIASRIYLYASTQPHVSVPTDDERGGAEEAFLKKVFLQVRGRTGRDFNQYKRSTLMRRILRRMQLHHIEELDGYLELLRSKPEETTALADEFLITVSNFFRDREVFEELEKTVIPQLFGMRGPEDRVRVWSVGCATGEEAYSLAILLLEESSRRESPPQFQIFATDLHERSLQIAREGFYTGAIQGDVSEERLRRFFTIEGGGYRIRDEVRELVVFAPQNVMGDPPFSKMDLISCRNVFIYLQRGAQENLVRLFHYALNPDGFLLLGTSETIDNSDLFMAENKNCRIYRKRNVPPQEPNLPFFSSFRPKTLGIHDTGRTPKPTASYGALHERMVERYAPPSMLVNEDYGLVHLSEHAGRYLAHRGGELSSGILKLVREELRVELWAALRMAQKEQRPVRTRPIFATLEGKPRSITIDVRPARDPETQGLLLVIFDERDPEGADKSGPDGEAAHVQLEAELSLTKQSLQDIIEDYETSQEEMKAANEELQSVNEEMRSMMEELETSKEELQSMNEELLTANLENKRKVEELSQLTADLQSLMAATDIATIFLDRDLAILRFTPQIEAIFNVRMTDRSRPITDFTHQLGYPDLVSDAQRVMATQSTVEREVRDTQGRWFLTRVLPYRLKQNNLDGVVITFIEFTRRKVSEEALRASEERYRTLFHSMEEAFIVIVELAGDPESKPDFRLIEANAAFEKSMGLANPVGRTMLELGPDYWPRHIDRYLEVIRTGEPIRFQERIPSAGGWFNVFAWRIGGPENRRVGVLFSDVTQQKRAENALRQSEAALRQRAAELEAKTDRLRWLAAELASAEQRERKRLAAVLHDDLQQILVATLMQIRRAGSLLDEEPAIEAMDSARDLIEQAIAGSRDLVGQLRPPVLYEEGLVAALKWLAKITFERYAIHVKVDAPQVEPILEDDLKGFLFESVRELLFNAVKHAGVNELGIEVGEDAGWLKVAVIDKGAGFDPGSLAKNHDGGYGLFSVRERIMALGGSSRVESSPGNGCRIELNAPMKPAVVEPPECPFAEPAPPTGEPPGAAELSKPISVLVIDNNEIVREGIIAILAADDRLVVGGMAGDGVEAIEEMERRRPDAALIDAHIPRVNAIEVTREITRRWPEVAVIGFSTQADEATAQAILAAGASTFLTLDGNSKALIQMIVSLAGHDGHHGD